MSYETLCSREEMLVVHDEFDYYRIPADNNRLNHKFFYEGSCELSSIKGYNSNNIHRLDVPGMKKLLLKLDFIRKNRSGRERSAL
jgi:UDP-glucose 4-epimerase